MNNLAIHKNNSEINRKQWIDLIQQSDTSSFFQTPECYDFYESLSFLDAFVFGVSENNELKGIVCGYVIADGGLLKRYFSRRAIIIGGVVAHANISENALFLLLQHSIQELKKKVIFIEVRNFNDYSAFSKVFEKAGFVYQQHLNFQVQTANVDTALKQLNTTKRRDIKKSKTEDASIVEIVSDKDLNEFYLILSNLYRTKVKTALFPLEFFEKLIKLPNGKIFGIKFENRIVGGSACVCSEGKAVYEWFVCGEDGKYKNIYPSTLATWADIEYAAENNFQYMDMMGAGKPDEGYGVREFKSKFGGELVEYGRFLFIAKPFLYKLGKKVVELVKR